MQYPINSVNKHQTEIRENVNHLETLTSHPRKKIGKDGVKVNVNSIYRRKKTFVTGETTLFSEDNSEVLLCRIIDKENTETIYLY